MELHEFDNGQTSCFCLFCFLFCNGFWITRFFFFFDNLVLDIVKATCNVILGVLSDGIVGNKGLLALFSNGYKYFMLGALFSSTRILGVIIFVLVAMVALVKFTLTKRPKDFTQWVSM
jgi:hypothetical protein